MKCIVLAAGYATRLYPLTENFPKPLLCVKDRPILDWLLYDIDGTGAVDEYIIISNHRYYDNFIEWKKSLTLSAPVTVIDDGTTENANRLGAVKDIAFAIEKLSLSDDLMVIAGDNVLDFSLGTLIDYFKEKDASVVMRYYEGDTERLKKSGIVVCGDDDRIIRMIEKSADPESNWCVPPFYIFKKADALSVGKAIAEGCGTDAPGSFVSYLASTSCLYAMKMDGKRYDIGNIESYEKVKKEYNGIKC
ncbi:MAG: nucleotidyltransferase family protein [Clostridia bacterium]|nr:nucleotidyltransferase family protein [Clostridia bacterium]